MLREFISLPRARSLAITFVAHDKHEVLTRPIPRSLQNLAARDKLKHGPGARYRSVWPIIVLSLYLFAPATLRPCLLDLALCLALPSSWNAPRVFNRSLALLARIAIYNTATHTSLKTLVCGPPSPFS